MKEIEKEIDKIFFEYMLDQNKTLNGLGNTVKEIAKWHIQEQIKLLEEIRGDLLWQMQQYIELQKTEEELNKQFFRGREKSLEDAIAIIDSKLNKLKEIT